MENNQTENVAEFSGNLLDDESIWFNQFEYASTGQRFLNFLIDNLVMNYGVSYLTGFAVGIVLTTFFPAWVNNIREGDGSFYVLIYLIAIVNYLFYYTLCEKLFNGYTLGKLITGTRAIREDGTSLSFKNAFMRSLIRLVPFEVFSGFKIRTWHDEWSKTMVVKSR